MEREGLGGFELLVIVIAGAALALVVAVWVGAWLSLAASGDTQGVPFAAAADAAQVLRELAQHAGHADILREQILERRTL